MRLDLFLFKNGKYESRTKASEAIEKGDVLLNGKTAKPSADVSDKDAISFVESENTFVSNGGYKLSKALKDFEFCVKGLNVIDIGASNGGFTDCLLKNGAKLVCAVDVGENQLHDSLKKDERVFIKDKTNARNLKSEDFDFSADLITVDVSFISQKYLYPAISHILKDGKYLITLIKPQFESDTKIKLKNGILKDIKQHEKICSNIYETAINYNLIPIAFTTAPIKKGKNVEYLMLFEKNSKIRIDLSSIISIIKTIKI